MPFYKNSNKNLGGIVGLSTGKLKLYSKDVSAK